jgi:hypothetical protein
MSLFDFNNFCRSFNASSNPAWHFFFLSSLSIQYGTSHRCRFREGATDWHCGMSFDDSSSTLLSDSDSLSDSELLSSDEYLISSACDGPLGGFTVVGIAGNMFRIMTI